MHPKRGGAASAESVLALSDSVAPASPVIEPAHVLHGPPCLEHTLPSAQNALLSSPLPAQVPPLLGKGQVSNSHSSFETCSSPWPSSLTSLLQAPPDTTLSLLLCLPHTRSLHLAHASITAHDMLGFYYLSCTALARQQSPRVPTVSPNPST